MFQGREAEQKRTETAGGGGVCREEEPAWCTEGCTGNLGSSPPSRATAGHVSLPTDARDRAARGTETLLCHVQDIVQGGTPMSPELARAKAPQITSETKEAAKTCRVIADKHIIYSGYAGGKPQTTSRQERRGTTSQREKGKSTRRDESKSVNHRGCCSSPHPPLVFPAQEISSLQILQGGAQKPGV